MLHLPLRYEDETRLTAIAASRHGAPVQVEGVVTAAEIRYRPRRQLVIQIEDFLNFYPSQLRQLATGARVRLFGEVREGFFGAEMVHPRFRVVSAGMPLPQTLTPIYPTTAGLGQAALRRAIDAALGKADLSETLPDALRQRLALDEFESCVRRLHHPPPDIAQQALNDRTHAAWQRLKFDELLAQQLSMRLAYRKRRTQTAPALAGDGSLRRRLQQHLPFPLTGAQQRVIAEISADLARAHPMQRLLHGDVGSGKTLVAAIAALQALEAGWQVALMAPTELLAEQHQYKLSKLLAPIGIEPLWLAGAMTRAERRRPLQAIADGGAQLLIGTHALFQDQVSFARLGLAIIDEQHRFGVAQRLALRSKGSAAGSAPHQLMMSATPIPRTLSMSYFADLDVSVIDELPPGRAPVVTKLVSEARRDEVLARVRAACGDGAQAYWICPLIADSGDSPSGSAKGTRRGEALQLQNAVDTFEKLRAALPELHIGLVHGRLKAHDKTDIMHRFQHGGIDVLVATTVVEVGVDVPNASVMVIEHAERMGLAQLHQLRGRVGRGARASVAILLYQTPLSELARARLKVIYESADGFEIAREDLRLRGPGEYLGERQSGVPLLRFADLEADLGLLEAARDAAEMLLDRHPDLARKHLDRWLGSKEAMLKV